MHIIDRDCRSLSMPVSTRYEDIAGKVSRVLVLHNVFVGRNGTGSKERGEGVRRRVIAAGNQRRIDID